MTEVSELKPCPFCDSKADILKTPSGGFYAYCTAEECEAEVMGKPLREQAVAAWNRRARPSPTGEKVDAVERFSSSNIMWSLDRTPLLHDPNGEWVRYEDYASTIAALVAERDDLATKWQQAIAIGMLHADRATTAESALATANARVEKMERAGKFLANAAENFACRFTMNSLAEDDDRQRQAVLDQTRLFRAALTGGENG